MPTKWETAKCIEMEGRLLYKRLSRNAANEDLSGLFAALSLDEQRHWDLFDHLEKGLPLELISEKHSSIEQASFFHRFIFALKENGRDLSELEEASYGYSWVLTLEMRSVEYCKELLGTVTDGLQTTVINRILNEDRCHGAFIRDLLATIHDSTEAVGQMKQYHLVEH